MNQPLLFDNDLVPTAQARKSDPITSVLAAERVERSGSAASQREAVLSFVRSHSGLTSAEIAKAMQVNRQMPARRLPELAKVGLIRKGDKRTCGVAETLAVTWWPAGACQ